MYDSEAQLPELQLLAVAEGAKRVGHLGYLMEAELASALVGQPACTRDMIGMNVRIDDVLQAEAAFAEQSFVWLRSIAGSIIAASFVRREAMT